MRRRPPVLWSPSGIPGQRAAVRSAGWQFPAQGRVRAPRSDLYASQRTIPAKLFSQKESFLFCSCRPDIVPLPARGFLPCPPETAGAGQVSRESALVPHGSPATEGGSPPSHAVLTMGGTPCAAGYSALTWTAAQCRHRNGAPHAALRRTDSCPCPTGQWERRFPVLEPFFLQLFVILYLHYTFRI